MDPATVATLGRQLREAERTRTPRGPLSEQHEDLDLDGAYAIQEAYSRHRRDDGARLVGRKIGCTSEAIQERFSINTPDYGQLFSDMRIEDAGAVPSDELIAPMVEPEIGFVLDRTLAGPGVTTRDVLEATGEVVASLEVIDSRIDEWQITFEDTIADNGSSARYVLGSDRRSAREVDLAAERVQFFRDGKQIEEGTGRAVLGHPAKAVAWLANALARFDQELRAGEHILSGSMTNASDATRGDRYEARFDTLGLVSCHFT